jgi:YD repeat-containing protein
LSQAYLETVGTEGSTSLQYVAVAPDGTVFLTENSNWSLIRRIGTDGTFSTVAGTPTCTSGYVADGAQATSGCIVAGSLAVGPDGTLYFVDRANAAQDSGAIRAISPDGLVRTLTNQIESTDTPAVITAVPDGTLLLGQHGGGAGILSRLAPPVTGSVLGGFTVADTSGKSVYAFDGDGRHRRTLDAVTGASLDSFTYDAAGRLSSVTDVNGDATTISRDANGNPTSITNAFGQQTTLTVDANGYLATVGDAAGDTYTLNTATNGLLQSFATPRSGVETYTYDSVGRLVSNVDPAGGGVTLSNSVTGTGNIVTRTTAMGLVSTYELDSLPSGEAKQVVTGPNNLAATGARGAQGGPVTSTATDGTTTTVTLGPDPRFGMQAPVATSVVTTTPGHRTLETN